MSGKYITFEGPEGCGKSTQLKMLYEALQQDGYDVVMTKEPGGLPYPTIEQLQQFNHDKIKTWYPATQGLRDCLLSPEVTLSHEQESLIFWVDRIVHHITYVKPMLAQGKLVLGDRDFDSSWAYQHYARGLTKEWMLAREREAIGDFRPAKTLLYTGDVDQFLRRVNRRKTLDVVAASESKFDDEQLGFHEKVQGGFLDRAKNEPERFVVLDGMKSIDELFADTYAAVKRYLG